MDKMLKFIRQIKDGKKLSDSQEGIKDILNTKFNAMYDKMKMETK